MSSRREAQAQALGALGTNHQQPGEDGGVPGRLGLIPSAHIANEPCSVDCVTPHEERGR